MPLKALLTALAGVVAAVTASAAAEERVDIPAGHDTLHAIVTHCRDELVPGRFIQDEATILASAAGHFGATHALMGEVLDFLTRSPAG